MVDGPRIADIPIERTLSRTVAAEMPRTVKIPIEGRPSRIIAVDGPRIADIPIERTLSRTVAAEMPTYALNKKLAQSWARRNKSPIER